MTFTILKTRDLQLREIFPADATAILKIRSNPQILEFMDRHPLKSISEAITFIHGLANDFAAGKNFYWGIAFISSGELIGTAGFHRWTSETGEAEIAYELLPEFWRRGFISQALDAMIDFGFREMKLQKIIANVNPANIASRRLLEKFHFEQTAFLKKDYYFAGKYLDTAIYQLERQKKTCLNFSES